MTASNPALVLTADGGRPRRPKVASGGLPLLGHLLELRRNPLAMMRRVHEECGEVGVMKLGSNPITMFFGATAQEAVFRAPDEQLDQAAAYPFMKPIFGPGVVFDATPEQRKQAMRNQSPARLPHARPRRGHRRRGPAHDRRVGVRAASSTSSTSSPSSRSTRRAPA